MFVQGKNRIGSKGQLVTPDGGQKFTILYIKIKQKKRKKKKLSIINWNSNLLQYDTKCISHTECTFSWFIIALNRKLACNSHFYTKYIKRKREIEWTNWQHTKRRTDKTVWNEVWTTSIDFYPLLIWLTGVLLCLSVWKFFFLPLSFLYLTIRNAISNTSITISLLY